MQQSFRYYLARKERQPLFRRDRAGRNYEKQKPAEVVLKSLELLLKELLKGLKLPKNKVFGHRELTMYGNATACPGRHLFPYVQKFRKSGNRDSLP